MLKTIPSRAAQVEPIVGNLTADQIQATLKTQPAGVYDITRPMNANTFISVPDVLQPKAVSVLLNSFAPIKSFVTVFEPNPITPRSQNQIKFVTTASSTQSNPTNFQTGGSTINSIAVPVTHYSQPWSVTNKEYNGGLRVEDLFEENALALATTIAGALAANFTTTNFTATPIATPATSFSLSNAATAFAAIKKSPIRSLILDGEFYANLSHVAGFEPDTTYGWTNIFEQSAGWSSAGTNVRGIATAPQAIMVVTGLMRPILTNNVKQTYISLGDIGIVVEYNRWMDVNTRTYWASLDVIFGSAPVDNSAAVLITNL